MLKRISAIITVVAMLITLTACSNPFNPDRPQLNTIKEICELETLTVKCNDVVIGTKDAGEGWKHFLETDRDYWIEYTGVVEMGVNADDTNIEVKDEKVYITLPEAKVLDVHVEPDSISEDSIYISDDGFFNKNKISADNQTEMVKEAQKQLRDAFEKDKEIKTETTEATKNAIKNYVDKLGESFDVQYQIVWKE